MTPGFVRRLREQTEGNAFFIEETLRALVDSDLPLEEAVTEGALERLGVPEGVAEVIVRRVRHLSPLGAEVLTAASVVGRDFRLGVVEQLVDATSEQVMSALEESMAGGLVLEVVDRIDAFAFSHALVREVLYRQLAASRRVRLPTALPRRSRSSRSARPSTPPSSPITSSSRVIWPGPARPGGTRSRREGARQTCWPMRRPPSTSSEL